MNWEKVQAQLKAYELNPHRLACGCAVKLDLQRLVYPALRALRPELEALGLSLAEREDADVFPRSAEIAIERRVEPLSAKAAPLSPGSHRGVTVTAAYRIGDPAALAARWRAAYRALLGAGARLHVGKGHTLEAYALEDEFIHFDLYRLQGPRRPGWWVANNDTLQLIDPTRPLEAPEQVEVALCNALNDLFSLGAVEEIQVHPFLAAPDAGLAARLDRNARDFCARHDFAYVPQPPVSERALWMGATVLGASSRQLPTFYRKIREGDWILVHRRFGDLAPLNALIERTMLDGPAGLDEAELQAAVDGLIETLRRPNLEVGRLIQRLCPDLDEPFDPVCHLKATGDLSGPGLDVFRELASTVEHDVVLEAIPLRYEELVRHAAQHFLLPDGTAGTNGAIFLVGSQCVIERAGAELEALGYEPHRVGRIGAPGRSLYLPAAARDFYSDWPNYRLLKADATR